MSHARAAHGPALELLDRALAYTLGSLSQVRDRDLGRPTPCRRWDLGQLLAHMDDALDAFAEGAAGVVSVDLTMAAEVRVRRLQDKACALHGTWSTPPPESVTVGDLAVDTSTLVLAAALEITVHGWDVAESTGRARPIPDDLARHLLPVARALVTTADRGHRFDAPLDERRAHPSHDERLLAFLGRDLTGPPGHSSANRHTAQRPAS